MQPPSILGPAISYRDRPATDCWPNTSNYQRPPPGRCTSLSAEPRGIRRRARMGSVQSDIGASRYPAGSEQGSVTQRGQGTTCEAIFVSSLCACYVRLPTSLKRGRGGGQTPCETGSADGTLPLTGTSSIECLALPTINCTVAVFSRILIRLKRSRGLSVLVLFYATLTPGAYSQFRLGINFSESFGI